MKKQKPMSIDFKLVGKIVLFVFIVISPFINFRYLRFLDFLVIKLLLLCLVVGLCFIDFQLALIATIAFLILVINFNTDTVKTAMEQKKDTYINMPAYALVPSQNPVADPDPNDPITVSNTDICNSSTAPESINEDMLTYFIDDKIKPYEVYIKMMVTHDNIDKAQGLLL